MTLPLIINPGDSGHLGDHEEVHGLLVNAVSPFSVALDASGTLAARPAAGVAGRYYYATDIGQIFRDTGSAWLEWWEMLNTFDVNILSTSPTVTDITKPACRVSKSVAQTLTSGNILPITFDTEAGVGDFTMMVCIPFLPTRHASPLPRPVSISSAGRSTSRTMQQVRGVRSSVFKVDRSLHMITGSPPVTPARTFSMLRLLFQ